MKKELEEIRQWATEDMKGEKRPSLTTGKCVELKESPKHGIGFWATDGFDAGEMILEYKGDRIDTDEMNRRHWLYKEATECFYFFTVVKGKIIIDATLKKVVARFVNRQNSGKEPNAYTGDFVES